MKLAFEGRQWSNISPLLGSTYGTLSLYAVDTNSLSRTVRIKILKFGQNTNICAHPPKKYACPYKNSCGRSRLRHSPVCVNFVYYWDSDENNLNVPIISLLICAESPCLQNGNQTFTNKYGTKQRIFAGISSRISAIILGKNLSQNFCQESWQEFLPRSWQEFLKGTSWTTIIKLPRTTIEQKINCHEDLVQILAKILARSWHDTCQDIAKIFLDKILPKSWQDLANSWIGTYLVRPHEILQRSWQDLAKIKIFFRKGWHNNLSKKSILPKNNF